MVICHAIGCDLPARCHVLTTAADGHRGETGMCSEHTLALAGRLLTFIDTLGRLVGHVADHRIEPECRHPDSRWVDDHCEIDGLEIIDEFQELIEVAGAAA